VSWFDGALNGVVPGVVVLIVLDVAFGAIAVYLLSRASSSDVK
jgi:ABC-2 type transport system permease protein